MSRPFVDQLRARAEAIVMGEPGPDDLTIRVQAAELWDTISVKAPATLAVLDVKLRALDVMHPSVTVHEDFVLKLHGIEVLDETVSLREAGIRDGSTLLMMYRRRRPIR